MNTIDQILLVAKHGHAQAEATARRMAGWLAGRGVRAAHIHAGDAAGLSAFCAEAGQDAAVACRRAVIVLGGDGTLVGTVRRLLQAGCTACPVLGIHFGRVGFLVEAASGEWETTLEALLTGRLPLRRRLALRWECLRGTVAVHSGFAVNDIVLSRRGALARVLPLQVAVDGVELGPLRADGVIVSTPAGTSGYAYSAGASLVHPALRAFAVAAISPFLSHFPSMVLPPECVVDLAVDPSAGEAFLTVDGQDGIPLSSGDAVRVRALAEGFPWFVPDSGAYFRRLRACGFTLAPSNPQTL